MDEPSVQRRHDDDHGPARRMLADGVYLLAYFATALASMVAFFYLRSKLPDLGGYGPDGPEPEALRDRGISARLGVVMKAGAWVIGAVPVLPFSAAGLAFRGCRGRWPTTKEIRRLFAAVIGVKVLVAAAYAAFVSISGGLEWGFGLIVGLSVLAASTPVDALGCWIVQRFIAR